MPITEEAEEIVWQRGWIMIRIWSDHDDHCGSDHDEENCVHPIDDQEEGEGSRPGRNLPVSRARSLQRQVRAAGVAAGMIVFSLGMDGEWCSVLMMMVVVKSKWTADTCNWLVIRLLVPMMWLSWWQWWMPRFWCPCQVPKGANRSARVGRRREQSWGAGQPQPGPARPRDQVGVEEIMFRELCSRWYTLVEMKVVEILTRQRAERERLLHLCGTDLSWSQRMLEPLQRGQASLTLWSFPPFLVQILGPF